MHSIKYVMGKTKCPPT